MRKDHSNAKYLKAEVPTLNVRIGPIIKEVIKLEVDWVVGQTVETEDSMEIIDTDSSRTIETTIFERTLGDMKDKIVEENTGITGMMIIIEVGIDQEKGHSQGIMVIMGIDIQAMVDQDQDLELVLIETE